MFKLNKKIEYSLMILRYLNEHDGEVVRARDICAKFQIPFDTGSRVMQELNSVGILKSLKGAQGGYALNCKLQDISFFDLHQIHEGPHFGQTCNGPASFCELYENCNVVGPLAVLNSRVLQLFRDTDLESLLKMPAKSCPPNPNSSFEDKLPQKRKSS